MNQTARMARLNAELRSVASFLAPWRRWERRPGDGGTCVRTNLQVERLEERTLLDSALGQPLHASDTAWTRWVTKLYHDLLQRLPAPGEVAVWTAALHEGTNPEQVAQSFTTSAEYRTNQIRDSYWALLGRAPETAGLVHWLDHLEHGLTEKQFTAALLASDEYQRHQELAGSDWLAGVYRDVLGRTPETFGRDVWGQALRQGMARAAVALGIVATPEAQGLMVDAAYRRLLGRPARAEETQWLVTPLAQGLERPALLATVAASPEGLRAEPRTESSGTADVLLVQLQAATADAVHQVLPLALDHQATVQPTEVPGLYRVAGNEAALAQLAATFTSKPFVRYAALQQQVQVALEPNDPKYTDNTLANLKGSFGIQAPQAWDATTGSTAVPIAVLDTGIDYTHPDLYRNIWINQAEIPATRTVSDLDGDGLITFWDLNNPANQGPFKIRDLNSNGYIDAGDILKPMTKVSGIDNGEGGWSDGISQDGDTTHVDDLVGWNFVTNTNNPFDDHTHGTHVAGTIGAVGNNSVGVVGVNWKTQLAAVKFIDASGNGADDAAAAAIRWTANHGIRISNNSWGGSDLSSPIVDAIAYARDRGHIFVAAAGNEGKDTDVTPHYPSAFPLTNILAVAATDNGGALAGFSNSGATSVDLSAPGVNVYSTLPGNSYGYRSGTSMATPHVAGAVGLILAQHPDWSIAQVIGQILDNVTPLTAVQGLTVSGGLLNAAAAVKDTSGPRVFTATSGSLYKPAGISSLRVQFQEAVDPSTFTASTLSSFTGPSGALSATAVNVVAGSNQHQFDITFPTQTALGSYSLVIGPGLRDWSGNLMNQNGNSTNGEAGDAYTASFALVAAPAFNAHFDFGTPTSPVVAASTQVTPVTTYSAARGYGWQSGTISSRDYATSTDVTRDLNFTTQGTFAVDLPNGSYRVTLTLGNTLWAKDQMGIFLEGTQLDSVHAAAGQVVTRTYTVTVSDAQLTLLLKDLGGNDPYAVINGLEIAPAADTTGARVVSASPTGTVSGPVDRLTLTFSEAIQDGTLTLADVVSLTGPAGAITATAVNKLSATQYEVVFPSQTALGNYSLTLGSDIRDLANNLMDQNLNGVNGENPGDHYTLTLTLAAVPTRFDFGTPMSPVAAGYTQVTPATTYSVARGHGWQSGVIDNRDYGNGTEVTRDLNFTSQGTFAVDLPNGSYQVTLTMGNALWAKEQMEVFLEGVQVDSVNAAVGEVVTREYMVTVADGQLTLLLKDLGGDDPYVVINGLELAPAADTTGARVVSASPTGTASGPVDRLTLTFSEAIQDGTFTLADVVSLTGPAGAITATAVNKLSATQYEVVFPNQTAPGNYSLTVGPDIRDLADNLMDQNQNGSKGEAVADRFSMTLTLVAATTFTAHFDFGTATSPVAVGYTQVTPTTTYSAVRGYGWQSGVIDNREYATGSDLTRDFNFTPQGTFGVDLPNVSYQVTLLMGSAYFKDQMGVLLEGAQVDSVNTAAGQVVTRTYTVTVNDGQLTVLLQDLGGDDPYVVINGLDIVPA